MGALAGLFGTLAVLGALGGLGGAISIPSTQQGHNQNKQRFVNDLMARGFSNADASYLADQYDLGAFNFFDYNTWGKNGMDRTAMERDLAEYNKLKDSLGPMPTRPDDVALLNEANSKIDKENADINNLYDQMLGHGQELFSKELDMSNQAYNDYRNQLLTNNAQSMNMVQGGIRSELDRQQRTAITRGASAAQRLVANINAQMGTQNKAAQQSLDTSNALAQSLLAQRQAASGVRQNYMNMLNNDTNRRADLMRGSSERKTSYGNSMVNQAYNTYNNRMDAYNDKLNATFGTNPYGKVLQRNATRQSYGAGI